MVLRKLLGRLFPGASPEELKRRTAERLAGLPSPLGFGGGPSAPLPAGGPEEPTPVVEPAVGVGRRAAGQAFIRRREKLASQLQKQGFTKAGAAREASRQLTAGAPLGGGEPGPQITAEQAREQQAAAVAGLEEAGAFEEVTPEEVPLAPSREFGAQVPILGPAIAAITSVLGNAVLQGWVPGFKTLPDGSIVSEETEFPPTEETLREATLREVRQGAIDEGISISESFGTLVESIPIVGGLVGKYAGGLTETPSANADNVIGEINKIKEAASTGQEKVRNGLEDPGYGLDRARRMEENIAALEGRLKLLINSSPILRANTDEVNRIQEEILEAREKVARYRQASSFGLTAQLTGTGRITPTDEQMYFELKTLKGGK